MVIMVWVVLATALLSLAVTPVVIHTARVYGLYDDPKECRRIHTRPIPRLGGVAVYVAMVVGLLAMMAAGNLPPATAGGWSGFLLGILVGGTLLFAAGLWDDLHGLSPGMKLLAQAASAAVVFAFGFRIEVLGFGSMEVELGWLAFPLTLFWVVAITNAFNLIDGLDGLATGIAVVALGTTLAVAVALGNVEVAVVCAALLGALLGFLRYNFNPARIFLGDSGSLFVGFMLAVLSVHGSLKSATAVLALVPLFALAIPLLDISLAIARRWLRGMPLSGADARHIHHRLIAVGLTQRRAVLVLYVAAIALAVIGVSLAFAPPAVVFVIAVVGGGISLLILLAGLRRLEYHEFMEAGAVLATGTLRVRRIIQDQIHARDVAHLVGQARSVTQLNSILEEGAMSFSFLGMQVCRETSPGELQLARLNGDAARAWKLDYPVVPRLGAQDDPYVLRIWCGPGAARPHGAERVARLLAPAIEGWIQKVGAPALEGAADAAVAPAPVLSLLEAANHAPHAPREGRGRAAPAPTDTPRRLESGIALRGL
jgi:UDP-GlcNAc:undecaprenyl-phosphate/decaprenyl-phosphate GlcNAc-1-phosphate transferase